MKPDTETVPATTRRRKAAKPKVDKKNTPNLVDATDATVIPPPKKGRTSIIVPKDFRIEESDRPLEDIQSERVKVSEDGTSIEIAEDTPLSEWLGIYDWLGRDHAHSGLKLGDAIVFAEQRYGMDYIYAMQKTGRALSTLRTYRQVALAVPPELRRAKLSFWHCQVVARIQDREQKKDLLKIAEKGETGKAKAPMSVAEFRAIAAVRVPKASRAGSNKPGRKPGRKPAPGKDKPASQKPAYEPKGEEIAAMDELHESIKLVNGILGTNVNGKLWVDLFVSLDYAAKKGLVTALEPIVELHKRVSFKLGYGYGENA